MQRLRLEHRIARRYQILAVFQEGLGIKAFKPVVYAHRRMRRNRCLGAIPTITKLHSTVSPVPLHDARFNDAGPKRRRTSQDHRRNQAVCAFDRIRQKAIGGRDPKRAATAVTQTWRGGLSRESRRASNSFRILKAIQRPR